MRTILLCLCLSLTLAAGCSGIIANPTYSALIDQTAAWTVSMSARADANALTAGEMRQVVGISANHWLAIKDAKNGKSGATTSPLVLP